MVRPQLYCMRLIQDQLHQLGEAHEDYPHAKQTLTINYSVEEMQRGG
jgi:hypothetical protein